MKAFNPDPNDRIVIGGQVYQIRPHPSVPRFAFGQEGRKAFVYQVSGSDGGLYALKKFKEAYRLQELVNVCDALARFSQWPGLEVCARECLHYGRHDDVLEDYPDLEYAVLMPWITGSTWYDMVINATPLNRLDALTFANATAQVLSALEESGLAHCDIAGPNVIINGTTRRAHLIDVEDLYSPDFMPPAALPAGTDGYAHRTASQGLWKPTADRFAGAILISEMAAWHDPRIRKESDEEHFFGAAEMQQDCARYQLMHTVLAGLHSQLAQLFEQAWSSENLEACPPMKAWYEVINELYHRESLSRVVSDWQPILPGGSPAVADEPPAVSPLPAEPLAPTVPEAQRSAPAAMPAQKTLPVWIPSRPIGSATPPPGPTAIEAPAISGPVVEWRPLIVPQAGGPDAAPASNGSSESLPASPAVQTLVSEQISGVSTAGEQDQRPPVQPGPDMSSDAAPADMSEAVGGLIRPVLDLSHVDSRNRPHLVWSESPGAGGYEIQEADNPRFNPAKEFRVKPDDTRWHPVWGRTGRLYYRIRATAGSHAGPWSETLSIRIGEA